MGGFNTQVFVNQAIAAGAAPLNWPDLLGVGAECEDSSIYVSDGPTSPASWAEDRTLKLWKAEAANIDVGALAGYTSKLYNSTTGVIIYAVAWGSIPANGVLALSAAPLATATVIAGQVLKAVMTANPNQFNFGVGTAYFFSIDPATSPADFNGLLLGATVMMQIDANTATLVQTDGNAIPASFTTARSLKLWGVIFANGGTDFTNLTIDSTAHSFKLYDLTAAVTIYTAINSLTPAGGTSSIRASDVNFPLTTYALPANNIVNATVDVVGAAPGLGVDVLSASFIATAE